MLFQCTNVNSIIFLGGGANARFALPNWHPWLSMIKGILMNELGTNINR